MHACLHAILHFAGSGGGLAVIMAVGLIACGLAFRTDPEDIPERYR